MGKTIDELALEHATIFGSWLIDNHELCIITEESIANFLTEFGRSSIAIYIDQSDLLRRIQNLELAFSELKESIDG